MPPKLEPSPGRAIIVDEHGKSHLQQDIIFLAYCYGKTREAPVFIEHGLCPRCGTEFQFILREEGPTRYVRCMNCGLNHRVLLPPKHVREMPVEWPTKVWNAA